MHIFGCAQLYSLCNSRGAGARLAAEKQSDTLMFLYSVFCFAYLPLEATPSAPGDHPTSPPSNYASNISAEVWVLQPKLFGAPAEQPNHVRVLHSHSYTTTEASPPRRVAELPAAL